MVFLDASVLVEACLLHSRKFREADALIDPANCTSAHALCEAYATLSGDKRLKIHPRDASRMILDCAAKLEVVGMEPSEVLELIQAAPARGICGGSFYDAIHAQAARKAGCGTIHTLNEGHFRHVAPDLHIASL
jgi:predicted nucleic acid-binding protein